MEKASKGAWIETMDDGVLYFKNTSSHIKEIKEKVEMGQEYEHNEENCIIKLTNPDTELAAGKKYLHAQSDKIVTVVEVERDEEEKATKVTIKQEGAEETTDLLPDQFNQLINEVDVSIRVLSKSGIKNTLKGKFNTNDTLKQSVNGILEISGIKANRYKVFLTKKLEENKIELPKDVDLEKLYESKIGVNLFAVESLGIPSKWKRFQTHYEGSEWSNSGSSADGIIFVPTKDVLLAGFAAWAPKTEPSYMMKYKAEVDGVVVEEDPNATVYTKFQDTYFNRIMFENPHEVKTGSRIKITIWISKDFSNSSYVYTYYGTNGSDYATVQNEHMGLFTLEASDNSGNGTSVYSGNIPEIFYYL